MQYTIEEEAPTPQPPAVKVGDRVLLRDVAVGSIYESLIEEVSPSGNYVRPKETVRWFVASDVLEVLPPRATGGT